MPEISRQKPWQRLGQYDRVIHPDGTIYSVMGSDKSGQRLLDATRPGVTAFFPHEHWEALRQEKGFRVDPDYFNPVAEAYRDGMGTSFLSDLSEKKLEKMSFKQLCVEQLRIMRATNTMVYTNASVQKALAGALGANIRSAWEAEQLKYTGNLGATEYRTFKLPKHTKLLQWKVKMDREGFAALRDDREKNAGAQRLDPAVATIIALKVGGYARKGITKKKVISDVFDEIDDINDQRLSEHRKRLELGEDAPQPEYLRRPNPKTVLAAIELLDPFLVLVGRTDLDTAIKAMPAVRGNTGTLAPLERVEYDETEVDAMVLATSSTLWEYMTEEQRALVPRIRLWLSIAIDVATRCIVGMRLSRTPTAESAVRTLEMITKDKGTFTLSDGTVLSWHQHGGLRNLVLDQGSAGISTRTRTAVADLGANILYASAGDPAFRGTGERAFRTLQTELTNHVDSKTMHNVVARGSYDSAGHASMTEDDICSWMVAMVVGIYHNSPHRSLHGRTPAGEWERLVKDHGVPNLPDRNRSRVVFGRKRKPRKVSRYGVPSFGLYYTCPELDEFYLHGRGSKEVMLAVDPDDISEISIKIGKTWYEATCTDRDVGAVTAQQWFDACEKQRDIAAKDAEARSKARRAAKRELVAMQDRTRHRKSIADVPLTDEELERAEKRIFGKYEHSPKDRPVKNGELGIAVPVPDDSSPAPTTPAETPDKRSKRSKPSAAKNVPSPAGAAQQPAATPKPANSKRRGWGIK